MALTLADYRFELGANEIQTFIAQAPFVRVQQAVNDASIQIDSSGQISIKTGFALKAGPGQEFERVSVINGSTPQTIVIRVSSAEIDDPPELGSTQAEITNVVRVQSEPLTAVKVESPDDQRPLMVSPPKVRIDAPSGYDVADNTATLISAGSTSSVMVCDVVIQNQSTGIVRIGDSAIGSGATDGIQLAGGASATLPGDADIYVRHNQGAAARVNVLRTLFDMPA